MPLPVVSHPQIKRKLNEVTSNEIDGRDTSQINSSKRQKTDSIHPCPVEERYNCQKTFSCKGSADRHAKLHEGKRFPCPLAKKHECGRDFASRDNAKKHAKLHQDKGKRLSCPQAKKCNCKSTFSTTKAAKHHVATYHQEPHSSNPQKVQSGSIRKNPRIHPRSSQRAPCPLAEKYHCKRTFITPKNAYLHAKIHVRNPEHRFPCPSAEIHHCEKTFATELIAKEHGKAHTRESNIPCPVAEKFNCAALLCNKRSAD